MKLTPSISESLEALSGKPAWGLKRTIGSMFFLEFGLEVEHGRTSKGEPRIHGESHFLFELCSWTFRNSSGDYMNWNDETIDSKFESLVLGSIQSADFSTEKNQLELHFTTDLSLTVTPYEDTDADVDADDTEWIFFVPGELAWHKTKTSLTIGSAYATPN